MPNLDIKPPIEWCPLCYAPRSQFSLVIIHDRDCPNHIDTTWPDGFHA